MIPDTQNQTITDPGAQIQFFCGFDWGRDDHYFVLKDRSHEALDEGYFPNTAGGYREFFRRLDAHRCGGRVAVFIESTRHSVTAILGAREWVVLHPMNPAKTRKLNELDGSGNGKNDPRDSHLICDHGIGNHQRMRIEHERDPDVQCLRELVEYEDSLIAERTRLKNRVGAQIAQFCPGLAGLVGGKLDTRAYSEYLLRFDPREPAGDAEVEAHLRAHRVNGKKSIGGFLEKHRALETLPLPGKLLAVHCEKLRSLVRRLQLAGDELAACQGEIGVYFAAMPDAWIYESMAGLGNSLAPRMAAFFGKAPGKAFADKREACAYFGQSPVTESSGGKPKERKRPGEREKKKVSKRRSCNRLARHTTYMWAASIARLPEVHAPWQREFLARCKERGDAAPTRYRKLGQKLVAILYTCLVNGEPYNGEIRLKNSHAN